jgi:hypothetical protein
MSQFYVYLLIVRYHLLDVIIFSFVVGCGGHFKGTGYFIWTVRKIGKTMFGVGDPDVIGPPGSVSGTASHKHGSGAG